MTRDEIINMARAAWKAALAQPETTAANYDLDAMAEAFSRVIEAHHSSTHPFHNPIDADAKIALRTLRGLIPGIKACARPPRDKWREAVIGALEICMILNDANRDDPERAMSDLMEWEPRDEWRPASEPPEDGRDVVVWMNDGGHGGFAIGRCSRGNWSPYYLGSPVTHWRDVTPPTESTIAAKCQRIEGSGEICGLTPPCPDCGSSLIDVPEGSL